MAAVAAWFVFVQHGEWAIVVVAVGAVTSPLFTRAPVSVPLTVPQLLWLALASVIAAQFAATGVGATAGVAVWLFGYLLWSLYRLSERQRERRAASAADQELRAALPVVWPVVVAYGSGRAVVFWLVFGFFGVVFVASLWLLQMELARGAPGAGLVLTLWHIAVLWILLASGSRAAWRITMFRDRIEMVTLIGRRTALPFDEVSEVRRVRWSPQGLRLPQLQLVDHAGAVRLSLDLGDAKQRGLLPALRGRLTVIPWRAEVRASWL